MIGFHRFLKTNKSSVLLFSLLHFALIFVLLFSGCLSRVDLYDMVTTSKISVINGDEYLDEGSGYCDFGTVPLYESAELILTVENSGYASLRISSISAISGARTQFFIDVASMTSDISAGSSTTFTLVFKPTSIGYKSAVIRIESSDGESFTFTALGYGESNTTEPDIAVMQGQNELTSSYDFGGISVDSSSAQVMFTILNKGDADLSVIDVSLSSGDTDQFHLIASSAPGTLKPEESMNFTITFSPTVSGEKYADVNIVTDDPDENPYIFSVKGYAEPIPEPDIHVKQGTDELPIQYGLFDFGHVLLANYSTPVVFTIENTGAGDLFIYSIGFVSEDTDQFHLTVSPLSLVSGGASTTFSLAFGPTSVGYKSTIISIESNDPDETPYEFTVEGYGDSQLVPDISVPKVEPAGSYDFSKKKVGDTQTEEFKIKNTGTGDLMITSVSLNSGNTSQFTIDLSQMSSHVAPNDETKCYIHFNPTISGDVSAVVAVYSNDPDEKPYTFTLYGYGESAPVPDIRVMKGDTEYPDGSTYNFGTVFTSRTESFIIENVGTDELVIQNILLMEGDPDFILDLSSTSFTLLPGAETAMVIKFDPTGLGDRWRNLVINCNDPDEGPYNIRLEGNY